MNLQDVAVLPVGPSEERHYQELMEHHHYLGALPRIGETLWYVGLWNDQWVALSHLLRCCLEVRGAGSMDRLELSPSV